MATKATEAAQQAAIAKIVPCDAASLKECGARLRDGELVAFPTETVYGLGCNAMDADAITKVFEAKERPLTDPLIVHVNGRSSAFELWDTTSQARSALDAICDQFWPGPLTIVAKAKSDVPPILMANTGFVACRSPSGDIARRLIDAARVPLAAPSANKFGHVSPTKASHVWDDLQNEDVWIVDSDAATSPESSDVVCNVGVESTVAKVDCSSECAGRVVLLRQGAVSLQDISECLQKAGLGNQFHVETKTQKTISDHIATVAPGQSIRHYSPDVPSFIVAKDRCDDASELSQAERSFLSTSVIIDFGGILKRWEPACVAYRDLSAGGDSAQAAKALFDTLRWTERVEGAQRVLFPEIVEDPTANDALVLTLKDKLTRAASGTRIDSLR